MDENVLAESENTNDSQHVFLNKSIDLFKAGDAGWRNKKNKKKSVDCISLWRKLHNPVLKCVLLIYLHWNKLSFDVI